MKINTTAIETAEFLIKGVIYELDTREDSEDYVVSSAKADCQEILTSLYYLQRSIKDF